MEISALNDDCVLRVLSFLTTEELLLCRAVCHRWASLAGHPSLWCNRRVSDDVSTKLVKAVLRFAPSLGFLEVGVKESADNLWPTLMATACATHEIQLSIDPDDAAFAALSVSRQAHLERLKELTVKLSWGSASPATPSLGRSLCALLLQICLTEGLEQLQLIEGLAASYRDVVVTCLEGLECATTPAPVSASLKTLRFAGSIHHFCDLLLHWHAETLEEVFIGSPASARLASLLPAMPRLRKLGCVPFEGMRALLQCPALALLSLNLYEDLSSEAISYVTEAARTQLQNLKLLFCTAEPVPSVRGLLLGLGGAILRSLTLSLRGKPSPSLYQEPLAGVLHRLPLLTQLDLDGEPTPALLRALDGRVLPELRQLGVRLPRDYSLGCPHHFIESEEVRGLMGRYPRLHVIMKHVRFAQDCDAAFCRDACHPPYSTRCVLYSHEAAARCDVSHRGFGDEEEETCCVAFHVATA